MYVTGNYHVFQILCILSFFYFLAKSENIRNVSQPITEITAILIFSGKWRISTFAKMDKSKSIAKCIAADNIMPLDTVADFGACYYQ